MNTFCIVVKGISYPLTPEEMAKLLSAGSSQYLYGTTLHGKLSAIQREFPDLRP